MNGFKALKEYVLDYKHVLAYYIKIYNNIFTKKIYRKLSS